MNNIVDKRWLTILLILLAIILGLGIVAAAYPNDDLPFYLPLLQTEPATPPPTQVEFRGVWVTRFDWTLYGQPANPAKIDEIVQNVSLAGFNAILFQVRGVADGRARPKHPCTCLFEHLPRVG